MMTPLPPPEASDSDKIATIEACMAMLKSSYDADRPCELAFWGCPQCQLHRMYSDLAGFRQFLID